MSDNIHQPSQWQKNINGQWHGYPSIFTAQGTHVGYNKVSRASEHESEKTTYWMHTQVDATGELAHRFDMGDCQMRFGVVDSDCDRIYCGPDFVGAGRPFGMLVDCNYYSPGWNTDLKTVNLILPEKGLQVYSSQLFEGPCLIAVFNGLYCVTHDYDSNVDTQRKVKQFIEQEKLNGKKLHVLPVKYAGIFSGSLHTYNEHQQYIGQTDVTINYTPVSLLKAQCEVTLSGEINENFNYVRSRNENTHTYEGPDIFGNGKSYGRVLWSTQHFYSRALKISSRETLIEDEGCLSLIVVWTFLNSDKEQYTVFGELIWSKGENQLKAQYIHN